MRATELFIFYLFIIFIKSNTRLIKKNSIIIIKKEFKIAKVYGYLNTF